MSDETMTEKNEAAAKVPLPIELRADSAHEIVAVEDLSDGDRVDLQGDPYADASGEHSSELRDSYQTVLDVEQETAECVRVGFDFDAIGFPVGHLVRRVRRQDAALEFFGLRVTLVEAHDGYPVLYVESSDDTPLQIDHAVPMLRVYVNDCCVSNDTPYREGETGQW